MRQYGLSKSTLTTFEQCAKRLWLQRHRPGLAEVDAQAEARFAAGHAVGEEACRQASARSAAMGGAAGVMIEAKPDLAVAVTATRGLLENGHNAPIFEATFEHDGVLVRCDLLEPDGEGGWTMSVVKSSGGAKNYHRGDLATQLWVAREVGVPVSHAVIRHVDTGFVLAQEGALNGLFVDAELTQDLDDLVAERPALVAAARAVLARPEPDMEPGEQCSSPFACEFKGYCRSLLPAGPEWPVTDLPGGAGKKWAAQGIDDMFGLDPAQLSGRARRVYHSTVTDTIDHDPVGARAAMAGWAFPRTWLDFETIAHVLPRWIGTRPYEQVPFQFTAIVERDSGEEWHEFVSLDGSDPRRPCAEALARLPGEGAVIAYNAGFEGKVIRTLALAFPDLAPALDSLATRLVDLLPVTRAHWYHRDQRGSWSIKAVLPTIAPHMNYDLLEVKHGGEAQEAWTEATAPNCTPERRVALGRALRAYCGQDVEAMRLVARALVGETR